MLENQLEQESLQNKHLKSLEFDKVLELVANCAKTPAGQAKCLGLRPMTCKNAIEKELKLVSEAKKISDDKGLEYAIPVDFIANSNEILKAKRLGAQDIWDLTKTLETSRRTRNYLQKAEGAELLKETFVPALISEKDLEDAVSAILDSSLNVRENASPELKRLKNVLFDTEANLKVLISGLLNNPSFTDHLQDTLYTKRGDRTVFQVKATDKNKVSGIVHDVSASSQTFFIEPEVLVPVHNRICQIESEINAEIERLLFSLSLKFHEKRDEILSVTEVLANLDCVCARAKYSIITSSNPAEISDEKEVEIQAMRHPLLIGTIENIVTNDFSLNKKARSLIITGSNTGGKTVTLKTVGLLSLMTNAGLHVPALFARIFPFNAVYADISEEQSIAQSLSTFSAHILNVVNILKAVNDRDLVLFDELGAGTDPEEGAALARAILEYLASKQVLTVTTTHLGELKILEYQSEGFFNASVEFDTKTLKPTYKLILGVAGVSNALLVAKNLDMPSEILEKARKSIEANQNPNSKVFTEIHKTHQQMLEKEQMADQILESAKLHQKKLNETMAEIKAAKKKTVESFKKKHQGVLEAARAEIKTALDELRQEKSEKVARRAYNRLAKLEQTVRLEFSRDEDEIAEKYVKINWQEAKIGQNVLIEGINQVAVLTQMPDDKGFCEVQMGLIKTKIKAERLAVTDKKPNKALKKLQVSFDDFHASANFSPRLDLRGMRVDEALDILEKRLDMASLRNINEVVVIHGHGTGALKAAVRDYLASSPYVAKFRSGEQNEGGDGISIVDIN